MIHEEICKFAMDKPSPDQAVCSRKGCLYKIVRKGTRPAYGGGGLDMRPVGERVKIYRVSVM